MFTDSLWLNLLAIITALIVVILTYVKWKRSYWKHRNMPYLNKKIERNPRRECTAFSTKKVYDEIKKQNLRFIGHVAVMEPRLYVIDLDLLKQIMTKDFEYFADRGMFCNEKDDPLHLHLFNLSGTKWRNLRIKLTSTFSSGKMKQMFSILAACGKLLEDLLNEKFEKKEILDIKDILACFTTDVVGSYAFGLECNTFENPDSPFRIYGKKIFDFSFSRIWGLMLASVFPTLAKLLHVTITPLDTTKFFMKVVEDTVNYREKNNIVRNDFLQMLIYLKNNNEALQNEGSNDVFGLKELAAQCFAFFAAGFEPPSILMNFASYELAVNQDIQDKVRNEIRSVLKKYNGEVTYDSIKEMTYLNQVLEETLRKYPPLPHLHRICVKDYKIPGNNFVIEKGVKILIPVYGIHHDSDHYPNPDKYDPERFNEENKRKRHPYAYIPFGEGPRNCIGLRFGLMQSKVGMVSVLRNYKITLNSRTKQPMTLGRTFTLTVDGGVWLDLEKC